MTDLQSPTRERGRSGPSPAGANLGFLHLLGFDHAEPDEEREMFGLQREILAAFAASDAR